MIERTRIFTALQGVRGRPPVDLAALEQLLVRFSQLVVEQRWIKEIDINPLLVSSRRTDRAGRPRGAARAGGDRGIAAAAGHPPLPDPVRPALDAALRRRGDHPADPPGGRAADGRIPQTLSEQSVYLRYFYPMTLSSASRTSG